MNPFRRALAYGFDRRGQCARATLVRLVFSILKGACVHKAPPPTFGCVRVSPIACVHVKATSG